MSLSLFKPPSWVDTKKPAGYTSLQSICSYSLMVINFITLKHFFYSLNVFWFLVGLIIYVVFPYDYTVGKTFNAGYFYQRLLINTVVTIAYGSFWYITLYVLNYSTRKFHPKYYPSPTRVFHDVYYSFFGIVTWTVWEVVMVYCYSNGLIEYIKDEDLFSSPWNVFVLVSWVFLVPLWREFHFYFAHRFIHIRPLYKFIHSLHHRNVYPEPFSGLSMHPVEHLYYILPCLAPSIYLKLSPLHLLHNGMHLVLAPAAGHSGWEDHTGSDQYHYLHHSHFICNFGTPGIPFDKWFGTFRDKEGNDYKQEEIQANDQSQNTPTEKSNQTFSLNSVVPPTDQLVYNILSFLIFWWTWKKIVQDQTSGPLLGLFFSTAPVLLAVVINRLNLFTSKPDKLPLLWPFHDSNAVVIGHLVMELLCTVVPVYSVISIL